MKQGEIWLVNFDPQVGQGITKKRPAIIVNNNSIGILQLKVVVPITDGSRTAREWHVVLESTKKNGLSKKSLADCFQIKSLSNERFIEKIGQLTQDELDDVKIGLIKVLDLV